MADKIPNKMSNKAPNKQPNKMSNKAPNKLMASDTQYPPGLILSSAGKGRFELWYQGDGNLVIYDTSLLPSPPLPPTAPGIPIWNSNTAGHHPGHVQMQRDGNFVVYDNVGRGVWSSRTYYPCRRGVSVRLQEDGNLVIHGITPVFNTFNDQGRLPVGAPPGPNPDGNGINDVISAVEGVADVIDIVLGFL
jgi:hypothetical protein